MITGVHGDKEDKGEIRTERRKKNKNGRIKKVQKEKNGTRMVKDQDPVTRMVKDQSGVMMVKK